jgi:hypothetical protein
MRAFITVFLASVTLFVSNVARADGWQMVGSACTPDPDAIQGDKYVRTSNMGVQFKGTNTGTIYFICPVAGYSGFTASAMGVTYRDDTGQWTSTDEVQALLYRVPRASTSHLIISQLFSSSFSETTTTYHEDTFTHTFDFENYYYYVRVAIKRTSSSQTVAFYGVMLH